VAGFGAYFAMIFGGIWAAVGVLVTAILIQLGGPPWDDWILNSSGIEATAEPTRVAPTAARRNGRRMMEIRFLFSDERGQRVEGASQTSRGDLIARARGHQPLAIQYDPRRPARHRLRGESASLFGAVVVLPAAFAAAGTMVFLSGFWRFRRRRQVYVNGDAVEAEVTGVQETSAFVNRRRVYRVTCGFSGRGGATTCTYTTTNPPALGSHIWAFEDPLDPSRSCPA
jgi:hypothetical protein